MSEDKIEIGDMVRVDIHNAKLTLTSSATVKYVPQATGDSWIFKDNETNKLIHVSEGCTIELIAKYNIVNDALSVL